MVNRVSGRLGIVWVVVMVFGLLTAIPAIADLPRTYDVQRVDSPNPATDGNFGFALANVGDVNGDGKDDLLTGTDKHGNEPDSGQVAVINGANPTGPPLRVYSIPSGDADDTSGDRPDGYGGAVAKLSDITGDGIAEHVVSASGVDLDPAGAGDPSLNNNLGAVYVYDGGTGALLKRLIMPSQDRTDQTTDFPGSSPRFGRTLLSPAGLPPCAGNGGVGPCATVPTAVQVGDIDGDDKADLLVGATDYSETVVGDPDSPGDTLTVHPDSDCAAGTTYPGDNDCEGAGRVYAYSGASIASGGGDLEPGTTIKNPFAQEDDPSPPSRFSNSENFGILLIPIGDAGKCNTTPAVPAELCSIPSGSPSSSPDGRPDFTVMANGVDLFGYTDVGVALELDGDQLTVIKETEYRTPYIDSSWGIAMNGAVGPAIGDIAGSTTPDFYVPDIQWGNDHEAEGRGFIIDGNPFTNGSFREWRARLVDPTPQGSGQFGVAAAGLGDIYPASPDASGEVIVGAIGPHNPGTNENVINDVHIFRPKTEEVLQTISAPDAQGGEVFGTAIQPMGDLNSDGFVDLAVGAGQYDLTTAPCSTPCGDAGRVYIFASNNTTPASEPTGGDDGGGAGGGSTSPQQSGEPAAAEDTTAPELEVTYKKKQELRKKVALAVGCDEACRVLVKSKLKVVTVVDEGEKRKRNFTVRPRRARLDGGESKKVKLKISKKGRKKAGKALREKGGKALVKGKVRSRDAAGNVTKERVKIKLVPRK